jgi:uncharacterized protein YbjT (DUF2867 family)
MAKVLVSGASGFVGKRLILNLLEQGHEIYALCRVKGTTLFPKQRANLHYIWGDLRNDETLDAIPSDIEAAYYLVHSMAEIVSDLSKVELQVAEQFVKGLKRTRAEQIIYLGGIINDEKNLSPHLQSRLLVEKILKQSGIKFTILRASIIIGSGSASFEIIRDLCEKLPFMIAPKWVNTACQPIAIRDVIFYLTAVLLNKACYNQTFDIGGPEVLTFKDLLLQYAKFRHLRRWIMSVPVLSPRLSSFWLVFITSVRFSICFYLVESMKISSIQKLEGIKKIIPHTCLTYTQALELAFQRIAQNEVVSTWMDAWDTKDIDPSIEKYVEVPKEGCLKDVRNVLVKDTKEDAIQRIWCIGGKTGYYSVDWAWKLRGFIDKLIGGVGLNRGRRHPTEIHIGDSIDFWRVLRADKENGDLIFFSNMKVPGEAWLEFKLEKKENGWMVVQTATFRPRGILGRLYWYMLYPFHLVIFQKMAKSLAGF